jgi:hypothetical protein
MSSALTMYKIHMIMKVSLQPNVTPRQAFGFTLSITSVKWREGNRSSVECKISCHENMCCTCGNPDRVSVWTDNNNNRTSAFCRETNGHKPFFRSPSVLKVARFLFPGLWVPEFVARWHDYALTPVTQLKFSTYAAFPGSHQLIVYILWSCSVRREIRTTECTI